MFNVPKLRKPVKRMSHKMDLPKTCVDQKVWDALHRFGTFVTTKEYLKEDEEATEFWYEIHVVASNDEWDALNRAFGAMGIDKMLAK